MPNTKKKATTYSADQDGLQDSFHDPERLMGLTALATPLAWSLTVAGTAFILLDLYAILNAIEGPWLSDIYLWLNGMIWLSLGLICLFFAYLTRVISEMVFLALDVESNTRNRS